MFGFTAGIMAIIGEAILRHERIVRYGDITADAGVAPVKARTSTDVHEAVRHGIDWLAGCTPGVRACQWMLREEVFVDPLGPDGTGGVHVDQMPARWRDMLSSGQIVRGEALHPHPIVGDGWVDAVIVPVNREGQLCSILVVTSSEPLPTELIEAFDRLRLEAALALERAILSEELSHQAFHDALTGLPNRALFSVRGQQALTTSRGTDLYTGVAVLDLDDFKAVNDALGHGAGDELLKNVADMLRGGVRHTDTVARLGGDEFAILLGGLRSTDEGVELVDRVLDRFSDPIVVHGMEILVRPSVGLALSEVDDGLDTLLQHADAAMYAAKYRGARSCVVYDPAMRQATRERLTLRVELEAALLRREFELVYQPIVDLRTHVVVGVEALVRWRHPERGLLGPDAFIPVAEESGLIVPLGLWVAHEACATMTRLRRSHPQLEQVNVNVSGRQFRDGHVVDQFAEILADTGLDGAHLTLEVTENALLDDIVVAADVLDRLKKLGVRIAIDDFGTGYSSLDHLRRFPVDVLKIDRSFVMGALTSDDDAAFVKAIARLARTLRVECVAEGVETDEHSKRLAEWGVDRAQGYYYCRPVAANTFQEWLATEPVEV